MSSCRNRQTGTSLLLRLIFNTFGQIIIYQTTSTHKNVSGLSSVISVVSSSIIRSSIVSFCTFELNIFYCVLIFTQILSQTERYFSDCRFSLLERAVTECCSFKFFYAFHFSKVTRNNVLLKYDNFHKPFTK